MKDRLQGANQDQSGMVLPFDPLNLTFHHLNYYVPLTKVCCRCRSTADLDALGLEHIVGRM